MTDLAGPRPEAPKTTGSTPSPKPTASSTPSDKASKKSRSDRGKVAPLLPLLRPAVHTHLLPADRMPALGMKADWVVHTNGPEGDRSVGACQKTPLKSIGAMKAVSRSYTATVDNDEVAGATQVVAQFADDKSAWRAHQVLRSWRQDCEERLEYARKDVGPLRAVSVRAGTGENYRLVYGPKAQRRARAAAFGIMREGRFVSIVAVTFAPGRDTLRRDPSRVAVRRIAGTFS